MMKSFAVFILLYLSFAQQPQYLPKEGPLPICDIYAQDIARSGKGDFWEVDL